MDSNGHKQTLYPTRIDLLADKRSKVTILLNNTLATTLDLKSQVKQAHWNVKGLNFYQLHGLFDEMANELEEFSDILAERVTALGGLALGTARVVAEDSILPEYPFDITDGEDHLNALADRYAIYAKMARTGIDKVNLWGDSDTADLYTEISRAVDKRLWFLDAHLHIDIPTVSTMEPKAALPKAPARAAIKTEPTAPTTSSRTRTTTAKAASTPTAKAASTPPPIAPSAPTASTRRTATKSASAAKPDAKPTSKKPATKAPRKTK